jgi:hypothetical protein
LLNMTAASAYDWKEPARFLIFRARIRAAGAPGPRQRNRPGMVGEASEALFVLSRQASRRMLAGISAPPGRAIRASLAARPPLDHSHRQTTRRLGADLRMTGQQHVDRGLERGRRIPLRIGTDRAAICNPDRAVQIVNHAEPR